MLCADRLAVASEFAFCPLPWPVDRKNSHLLPCNIKLGIDFPWRRPSNGGRPGWTYNFPSSDWSITVDWARSRSLGEKSTQRWVILDNENVQEYFEGCGTDVWDMLVDLWVGVRCRVRWDNIKGHDSTLYYPHRQSTIPPVPNTLYDLQSTIIMWDFHHCAIVH